MPAYANAIINFHEMTPAALCDVISSKFHLPVEQTAAQVIAYFNTGKQEDPTAPAVADLQHLLFSRMQTECLLLIRKEHALIFPLIRNIASHNTRKLQPSIYENIHQSFQKILLMLQKIRQITSHYLVQVYWSSAYKLCISNMFTTEQLLQQWIYVEQNILYPAVLPACNIFHHHANNDNDISID
ncbi:MAG TPA: hypothetical protein VM802_24325 [Chitinophaga sp.]|uniref:hypothetical protein n=1 Tax=Chitinophaga sp. TaxID=1869181 RepID=UPI002C1E4748|nr:hypothetical protein [Chitinophaga sp.]HVI48017.1 hypothetical protein [Chitinophaga sp.]